MRYVYQSCIHVPNRCSKSIDVENNFSLIHLRTKLLANIDV